MKRIILLLAIILIFVLAVFMFSANKPPSGLKKITINNAEIFVEIADTSQTRARGLSGRESLPQNQGLLFIFGTPGQYSFWMKEMNFALDFLWISGDKIVEATKNVQPQDYQPPKTLTPLKDIDKVLELNAGTIERLNIKIGDRIEF